MNLAVLDLETNGFRGTSVLSVSAIVFSHEGRILDVYDRYYFPEEQFRISALLVNGLYPERVAFFRKARDYRSETFLEEAEDFDGFLQKWGVENVVVHNVTFDTAFLPPEIVMNRKWWCSMRGMTSHIGICRAFGREKFPKLGELKLILQEMMEAPEETRSVERAIGEMNLYAHTSLADCLDLYGIVMRVMVNESSLLNFLPMCLCFRPPSRKYPLREGMVVPKADSFVLSHLKLKRCLDELTGQYQFLPQLNALIDEAEAKRDDFDPAEEQDQLLNAIRHAMAKGEKIPIRFTNISGEVTERDVLPIGLFYSGNQLMMKAYCCLRGEDRIFNLARTELLELGKGELS